MDRPRGKSRWPFIAEPSLTWVAAGASIPGDAGPQSGSSIDGRYAAQNAALMLVQRGLQGLGGLVFAMVVPRMMGPGAYGSYALVTSLAGWFLLLGGLGLTNVIGRYMPGLVLRDAKPDLRHFVGNLVTLRLLSSGLASLAYLVLTLVALRELDGVLLWLVAGSVWIQGISTLFFALFLGLNRADLWGSGDTLRRWLMVILVPLGVWLDGLRGAGAALIVTELAVLALGIRWIPLALSWRDLRPRPGELAPYLRFGLTFFASQVLLAAFQASGEVLVRAVSGDYVEVAYFALAHNVYLTVAASMPVLAWSFAPLLREHLERADPRAAAVWIDRLVTWFAVVGVVILLGCLFLADSVTPLVLGAPYAPVAANLVPLCFGLVMLGLGTVTNLLALVYGRPGEALVASTVRIAAFAGLGVALVAWRGSWGACVAVAGASTLHAVYFAWRLRTELGPAAGRWAAAVGLGVLPMALVWLRSSLVVNAVLCAVAIAGYTLILLACRVVRMSELRALGDALRSRARAEANSRS
jgi:O-antigen/teichoic acid export membrane protein